MATTGGLGGVMQMHKTRASGWGDEAASGYEIWDNTKNVGPSCMIRVRPAGGDCKA